jgi:hypothetical protein
MVLTSSLYKHDFLRHCPRLKQASGGFEFGSFRLAGHLRVTGFGLALSKGAGGRAPLHFAWLTPSPPP